MENRPVIALTGEGLVVMEWAEPGGRFGLSEEADGPGSWYFVATGGVMSCGALPQGWINWGAVHMALEAGAA